MWKKLWFCVFGVTQASWVADFCSVPREAVLACSVPALSDDLWDKLCLGILFACCFLWLLLCSKWVRKSLHRRTKGFWVGMLGSLWLVWLYPTFFSYLQVFLLCLEWFLLFPLLCFWYFCLLLPSARFFCTWCCFISADKEGFLKSGLQILVYPFFCFPGRLSAEIAALQGISWGVAVEKPLNCGAAQGINNDPV